MAWLTYMFAKGKKYVSSTPFLSLLRFHVLLLCFLSLSTLFFTQPLKMFLWLILGTLMINSISLCVLFLFCLHFFHQKRTKYA